MSDNEFDPDLWIAHWRTPDGVLGEGQTPAPPWIVEASRATWDVVRQLAQKHGGREMQERIVRAMQTWVASAPTDGESEERARAIVAVVTTIRPKRAALDAVVAMFPRTFISDDEWLLAIEVWRARRVRSEEWRAEKEGRASIGSSARAASAGILASAQDVGPGRRST